jgi:DNA (cytosine-5)-methyltransferase 1
VSTQKAEQTYQQDIERVGNPTWQAVLAVAQRKWPTPVSSPSTTSQTVGATMKLIKTRKREQGSLMEAVVKRMLPTPTASMMPCEGTVRIMRKVWEAGEMSLEEASAIAGRDVRKAQGKVKAWPTPQASDHRDRGNLSNPSIQRRIEIGKQVNLSMCVSPVSGQLNPTWVEWLMGWPLGWTDLKPLETDKFHCVPQQHGKYSVKEFND